MILTTRTLPAQWAAFLLGANLVAHDPIDARQAAQFLARERLPMPAFCTDETRQQWQNDAHACPHGGEVCEFIFLLP